MSLFFERVELSLVVDLLEALEDLGFGEARFRLLVVVVCGPSSCESESWSSLADSNKVLSAALPGPTEDTMDAVSSFSRLPLGLEALGGLALGCRLRLRDDGRAIDAH